MDKYDKAIEYLRANPGDILLAWFLCGEAKCLFQYCSPSGHHNGTYGCLTMIRAGSNKGSLPELTDAIAQDERLPKSNVDITLDHLPIFAEWQRRIDYLLNRGGTDAPDQAEALQPARSDDERPAHESAGADATCPAACAGPSA